MNSSDVLPTMTVQNVANVDHGGTGPFLLILLQKRCGKLSESPWLTRYSGVMSFIRLLVFARLSSYLSGRFHSLNSQRGVNSYALSSNKLRL